MIPPDEQARFAACTQDAWSLAAQGSPAEGYTVLDLGLCWAETPALNPFTGEQSPPEPWAAELIALYRGELARYIGEHRKALGGTSLTREAQFTRAKAADICAAAQLTCQRSKLLQQRFEASKERGEKLKRRAQKHVTLEGQADHAGAGAEDTAPSTGVGGDTPVN